MFCVAVLSEAFVPAVLVEVSARGNATSADIASTS